MYLGLSNAALLKSYSFGVKCQAFSVFVRLYELILFLCNVKFVAQESLICAL